MSYKKITKSYQTRNEYKDLIKRGENRVVKKRISFFITVIIALLLFIIINLIFATNIYANINLNKVNNSTIINSDYNFAPRFNKKTTYTFGGMTNYAVDNNTSNNSAPDYAVSARLTSESQKGKIWIRYNNIGEYNGSIIDMKITLNNWKYLQPANQTADNSIGGVNYPTVFFRTNKIGITMTASPAISEPEFLYTFYKHGTNTVINVKRAYYF